MTTASTPPLGLDLSSVSSGPRPELSVVVPVHNEEGNIPTLLSRLGAVLKDIDHEIVITDDGSRDGSLEALRKAAAANNRLKVISLSRNFGHQVAVTVGLEYSRGKAIVIIDADLQDPPEVIPEMLAKWREGYDVVFGQRSKRKGETFMKKFTAKVFYRVMKSLTQFSIPVDTGDFRLVSRRVADAFLAMPERHRFVRGMFSWVGFRQTGVLYSRDERLQGKTNYTYGKMIRFAFDGLTSFSFVPLRLASYVGFLAAVLGFVLIVYSVYQKLYGAGTMRGWASLSVIVLFLGGTQLVMIGLLGEYLGRVHDEMKHRPLYIVKEKVNLVD
jgi:polyisoprenyl-phosphate glycosyltransferase